MPADGILELPDRLEEVLLGEEGVPLIDELLPVLERRIGGWRAEAEGEREREDAKAPPQDFPGT